MKNIKNIDVHRIVHSKYFFYGVIGTGLVAFVAVILVVLAPGNMRSIRGLNDAEGNLQSAQEDGSPEWMKQAFQKAEKPVPLTEQEQARAFVKDDPKSTQPMTPEEMQSALTKKD